MSRDVLLEIARRALEPETAIHGDQVPGESPIEERLRQLQESLLAAKERQAEQDRRLAAIRADIADYKSAVDEARERLGRAENQRWALRDTALAPQAAVDPVGACPPALSHAAAVAALASAPAPRNRAWIMPYAAMALAAAAFAALLPGRADLLSRLPSLSRAGRRSLSIAAVPPPDLSMPMPGHGSFAAASPSGAAAPAADDERNNEVLALVYAYVPPGRRHSVREILAPEIEGADGSPWVFARVDDKTTLVSFHPYGEALENAPVYEFAVDPVTKVVFASPETVQNLRGASVAAR